MFSCCVADEKDIAPTVETLNFADEKEDREVPVIVSNQPVSNAADTEVLSAPKDIGAETPMPVPPITGDSLSADVKESVPAADDKPGNPDSLVPTQSGFRMEFKMAEGQKEMVATQRPLGMVLNMAFPVVVAVVSGHASELGIKEGWELTSFDGVSVEQPFHLFYAQFVRRSVALLPGPPVLVMVFEHRDETYTMIATMRPLGLTFNKELPVKVQEARGHAKELGVQTGWRLTSFGDDKIDAFPTFDEFFAKFQECVSSLPAA